MSSKLKKVFVLGFILDICFFFVPYIQVKVGGAFGVGGEEKYVSMFDGMMHVLKTDQFGFFLLT